MNYIWVRATANWADEAAFLAQLDPRFKPHVDLWNDTFDMPFHIFRHEVRKIAALNLSRVDGATLAPWDEIPEGSLVVPVDDDDWFAPDLVRILGKAMDPHAAGCYWIQSWVEVPLGFGHQLGLLRRRVFPRTAPRWICTTNNYALRKGPDATLPRSHVRASAWFMGEGRDRVRRIDERLSVANRTLASMTSLRWRKPPFSRSRLIRRFRKYQSLYRAPLPELAWCEPYLQAMTALMDRLHVRGT